MIIAVQKLHDPDHGVYGIALRGQRGSGANVWRWMPYFRGFGGKWFDGNTPAFDGEPAVKATQTYLDLFKYSPPAPRREAGTSPPAHSFQARWRCSSNPRHSRARRSIRKCRMWSAKSAMRGRRRRWPVVVTPTVSPSARRRTRKRREKMRRFVHRLGDVKGQRKAAPRRRPVRRAESHQHHQERRFQPEIWRGPR